MKINGLDWAIAVVGGLTFMFLYLDIPLWALFIGWAWYFALGAKPNALVAGIPPTIVGALMAIACFVLIDWLSPVVTANVATGIALFITLFIIMLLAKIPALKETLPFFNAYSCYFIGFAAKTFVEIDGIHPYISAMLYITGANIIGLFVGYVTIVAQKMFDRMLSSHAPDPA